MDTEEDFDEALAGDCEGCGEPGALVVDPYDADVNNQTSLTYLCGDCYEERALDI